MSFQALMSKVRHLDNQITKWMMGHFYILFFQIFLVFICALAFINIIKVIDIGDLVSDDNLTGRLLLVQSTNSNLIVVLLLLNSFWMLFIFNGLIRIRSLLKDIYFALSRGKGGHDY